MDPPTPPSKHELAMRVSLLRRGSLLPTNTSIEPVQNDEEISACREKVAEKNTSCRTPINQQQQPHISNPDESLICKHYNMCVKMFSENKINAQNVWNLHMIDYMSDMLSQTSISNRFKAAAVALDVSTKVYGIKVDDICSEGKKLANAMTRNAVKSKGNIEHGIDHEQPLSDEEEERGKKNKKNSKRNACFKKTTIQQNICLLVGPVLQAANTRVDLLTTTVWGNAESLLMRKLPLSHGGNKLEMFSNTAEFLPKEQLESSIAKDKLLPKVFSSGGINFDICPTLTNFIIDQWNQDDEDISVMSESMVLEEVIIDDDRNPIAELDVSDNDDGVDIVHDIFEEERGEALQLRGNVVHIKDFRPQTYDTKGNEYLHNADRAQQLAIVSGLQAGPSHWKVKYIHNRETVRYTGRDCENPNKKPRRNRKDSPSALDFNTSEEDIDDRDTENIRTVLKRKHSPDSTLVPIEVKFYFDCSLLNEDMKICLKPDHEAMNVDVNDGSDVENPDVAEYFSLDTSDNVAGETEVEKEIENGRTGEHCNLVENLVDAPPLVPKTFVNYSTKAKNMNMKKLKAAVHKTIEKKSVKATMRPDIDECTFSEVYHELPKVLPAKMAKNVTCPLAFVALLHVASENNLELKDIDHKDITISKQSSDQSWQDLQSFITSRRMLLK